MGFISQRDLWMLAGAASAALAGRLMRSGAKHGWKAVTREDPPSNPASSDVSWSKALAWAVLTGAMVGVARVVARRGAAAGWVAWKGRKPPGL